MEDIFTEITDPNVVLHTITSQNLRLSEEKPAKETEAAKSTLKYNKYSDREREIFIDRIIEVPEARGNIARFARELSIDLRTAE